MNKLLYGVQKTLCNCSKCSLVCVHCFTCMRCGRYMRCGCYIFMKNSLWKEKSQAAFNFFVQE